MNGGDNSGRPDTSLVSEEVRDVWVTSIEMVLESEPDIGEYQVAGVLRSMDTDLNKDPEMYCAVLDRLVELKIISKQSWRNYLKVQVEPLDPGDRFGAFRND